VIAFGRSYDWGGEMRKFAVAVLLLCLSSLAFAQIPGATPFSGDMTMKLKDAPEPSSGKVYFSGSKVRYEMNMKGHEAIMIHDMPSKVTYMLMPQQMMYMEFHGDKMGPRGSRLPDLKAFDPANPCAAAEGMTCKKVGSETVNGRSTEKWIFTSKDNKTSTVWLDNKLHFPIRTVSDDAEMNMNNIKEGMPESALFVIPPAYRKFEMGGGRMPQ
jgi:hypothetical protein